jgi:hypothetical protein
MFISSPSKSALYGGVTDRFSRKAVLINFLQSTQENALLTRVWHQPHSVAHHTHFVQTRLSVEQHEAEGDISMETSEYPLLHKLTLHPSDAAQQSTHIAEMRLRAYYSADQYARRYLSRHSVHQGM